MKKAIVLMFMILLVPIIAYAADKNYWTFDSTLDDSIGTDGLTHSGTPTYSSAIQGNGINCTADYSYNDTYTTANTTITISFWVKIAPNMAGQYARIWSINEDDDAIVDRIGLDWIDHIPTGQFRWYMSSNNGAVEDTYIMLEEPSTNTWYHAVMVREYNDTVTYYLDGSPIGNAAHNVDNITAYQYIKFCKGYDSDQAFYGIIDNVYISTTPATQTDVTNWYNGGSGYDHTPVAPDAVSVASFIQPPTPQDGVTNSTLGQNITVECTESGNATIWFGTDADPVQQVSYTTYNETDWIINSTIVSAEGTYYYKGGCSITAANATNTTTRSFVYSTSQTSVASFMTPPTPPDGRYNNTLGQNISVRCTNNGNATIWIAINTTPPNIIVASTTYNETSWLINETYVLNSSAVVNYVGGCTLGVANTTNTTTQQFIYEASKPVIITYQPPNRRNAWDDYNQTHDIYNNTILISIFVQDSNNLQAYRMNITKDGISYYNFTNSSILQTDYTHTDTLNVANWPTGEFDVLVEASDAHTSLTIDDYKPKKLTDAVEFDTPEGNLIKIESFDSATIETEKLTDRYTLDITFLDKEKDKDRVFFISANNKINYLKDSKYLGHFTVLGDGVRGNWIDFELESGETPNIHVTKINDYLYRVELSSLDSNVKFKSIGGMNLRTMNYIYTHQNFTVSSVTVTPTAVTTVDDLRAYCTGTESGGADLNMQWQLWLNESVLNGTGHLNNISSGTNYNVYNISAVQTVVNANYTLSCRVNATSGFNYTAWSNSTVAKVSDTIFDNCSNANITALNFTFWREDEVTTLRANIEGVINYTQLGAGATSKGSYIIDYTNITDFQICIFPNDANFSVDAYFQYQEIGENGPQERYFLDNLTVTNITQEVLMYNFNYTTGLSELTALVKSNIYEAQANVIIKMQRYYPAENLWRTVQIDRSDEFGKGIFWVIQNVEDYKFIFEQDAVVLDSTEAVKFVCDSATECEQTFTLPDEFSEYDWQNMDGYITYNNVTGIFSFTWNDVNGAASSVRFLVEKHATDTVIEICSSTATSSSGTLTCNVTAHSGIITARAFRSASPAVPWIVQNIEKFTGKLYNTVSSTTGMFLGGLLTIAIVTFGVSTGSAVAVVLMSMVSLIFLWFFSFTNVISISLVIAGFAVGLIAIFMLKK